jgi:hypothetical protein
VLWREDPSGDQGDDAQGSSDVANEELGHLAFLLAVVDSSEASRTSSACARLPRLSVARMTGSTLRAFARW